jgi:hypothetical protein
MTVRSQTFGKTARRIVALAALVPALPLASCVEQGDLGRPRPSVWNQTIFPMAGGYMASWRGEPVSGFAFTDEERDLRDRAFRFIMPAHELAFFERQLAELARTRVVPRSWMIEDDAVYRRALRSDDMVSPAHRFRRLSEDISADRILLGAITVTAKRVLAGDQVRRKTMAMVPDLSPADRKDALARIDENCLLIRWVGESVDIRRVQYRHALERLVIETPQGQAIEAERALITFERTPNELTRLACGEDEAPAAMPRPSGPSKSVISK